MPAPTEEEIVAPTNTGASGPEIAPSTNFPRTVGDCSLSVLAHLDKVRVQTQRGGVWKVMSKWAMDICKQMASSAAYKKQLNTNVEMACNHAKSIFKANSEDNDVRRSHRITRTNWRLSCTFSNHHSNHQGKIQLLLQSLIRR